jgi:hypothetical protein
VNSTGNGNTGAASEVDADATEEELNAILNGEYGIRSWFYYTRSPECGVF